MWIDDIQNAPPKLVIEASIDWNKNDDSASATQTIKLSTTSSYYNNVYPVVKGATIGIKNSLGESMGTFLDLNPAVTDDVEDGVYTAVDFKKPTINSTYYLTIETNGNIYKAEDTYTSIVDINEITQETITFPDEIVQLNVNIDNEVGVDNYYLLKTVAPFRELPEYENGDDKELSETSDYDITYFDEELTKDMTVGFTLYGVSKRYNDFLSKIIILSQGADGPFSTAPATVRGNIVNQTNQENYPLGYFSVNQFVTENYVVQAKK